MPTAADASLDALGSFTLDRSSPVPLYFQVAQHLEQAIDSGALPPGTLLLNEIALADALKLSRPTMRRAMQTLVDRGLVVRRRGIGTRVVQPKMRRPLELTSLHDDLRRAGQVPRTRVLSFKWVRATADISRKLMLERGDDVLELVRLRSARNKPIAMMTNYVPANIVGFTADDLVARGLYDLVREQGITLHSAHQSVGARTATPVEAKLLHEARGSALLTMQRAAYDDHGRVVEYGSHLYAASRYSFEINLLSL
jgi:GntR family transcriptional regulator